MDFSRQQILEQQNIALQMATEGESRDSIGKRLGLTFAQVKRRLAGARKREKLDPSLAEKLAQKGLTDLSGLHSGWLLEKDQDGTGHSLYFHFGPDQEKVDFAEAMREVLSEIPKLPPVILKDSKNNGTDYANWIFLADLHVGHNYGCPVAEDEFMYAIDDLIDRIPPAEKAVLCELGDLLDANDHKAVTPASGNPTDTIRDNHLGNTKIAIRMLKYAAYRLLETHPFVDVHLIRGNHDETAYIAVLLALNEHFQHNPRIKIIVPDTPEQEEFRVITWGDCAFFPHHGDKAKPLVLKDVWADQFVDSWAKAKMWRLVATAHFHNFKSEDMVGAEWRSFRTLYRGNRWARQLGLFSRGSLSVMTVHKKRGLENETISNLKPQTQG